MVVALLHTTEYAVELSRHKDMLSVVVYTKPYTLCLVQPISCSCSNCVCMPVCMPVCMSIYCQFYLLSLLL